MKKRLTKTALEFRNEFKKAIVTGITAAFGLITALAWKDFLTEYINDIFELTSLQSSFAAALFITLISVFALMFISKTMTKQDEKEKA